MANNVDNSFIWEDPIDSSFQTNELVQETQSLILDGKISELYAFLTKKARTKNIPLILKGVGEVLQSDNFNYMNFWTLVDVLTSYNAQLFLNTIYTCSKASNVIPRCNSDLLNKIVLNCFKNNSKLPSAIGLLRLCRNELSYDNKMYILNTCLRGNNEEVLKDAFTLLEMHPSIVMIIALKRYHT